MLVRTGYGCNNACRFCAQGDWRATRGDRPADEVLDEVRRRAPGAKVLVLSGGEATLRPELGEWVAAAVAGGARRVIVQTNGRMLAYRGFASRLVEAGAGVIAVALHGPNAAVHDWTTRVEGSFDQTVAGIRRARRAGARVILNTMVTRSSFRHLSETVRLAATLGASRVRFMWPRAEGQAAELAPSVLPNAQLAAPHLWRALAIAANLDLKASFDGPPDFPTPERDDVVQRAS